MKKEDGKEPLFRLLFAISGAYFRSFLRLLFSVGVAATGALAKGSSDDWLCFVQKESKGFCGSNPP